MQKKSTNPYKLWREISVVLFFKVLLILALWYFFFSDPVEKHLTVEKVAQQLVGNSRLPSEG